MKRLLIVVWLAGALVYCHTGALRVKVTSSNRIVPAAAQAGMEFSPCPGGFNASGLMADEWGEHSFGFTPDKDGAVRLSFRYGAHSLTGKPVYFLKDFRVDGGQVTNLDLSKRDRAGRLVGWKLQGAQMAKDGESDVICIKSSEDQVNLEVKATAGQRVTVSYKGKLSGVEAVAASASPLEKYPADANVTLDSRDNSWHFISAGRLSFRPTYENCGVYINRKPEEQGKKLQCRLWYRQVGAKEYREGHDPVEILQEGGVWRSSIFLLHEDTEYEVKVVLSGECDEQFTGRFRTRSSRVPILRTIVLSDDGKCRELTESGTSDGWIRYTSNGKVLRGDGRGHSVLSMKGQSYVLFENVTIDGCKTPAGIQVEHCENVIVRNCDISNFGRDGIQRTDLDGKYYTKDGELIYHDPGVEITACKDVMVERCFIHAPNARSNTWIFAHPAGPTAIRVYNCEGTVLRYNDLIGGDQHRYIDVVHGPGNGTYIGGLKRDADVYGNIMLYSDDDCIELEGGEMNIRTYFNRFAGTLSGTSTGSAQLGPSYVFRNLYTQMGDEGMKGGTAFKNGLQRQGYGTVYFFNNTAPGNLSKYGMNGFGAKKLEPEFAPSLKIRTRNNIISCRDRPCSPEVVLWPADMDYDLFHFRSPTERTQENKDLLKASGQELHAVYAKPEYVSEENGDFRLKPGSVGYGSAAPVKGLSVRHAGAFQDDGVDFLPYRPIPVFPTRWEIRFRKLEGTERFQVRVGGKGFRMPFKVHATESFFRVTPSQGVFESGKKMEFSVTLRPEAFTLPRYYSGAVLLRCEDGYGIPVPVYADAGQVQSLRDKALEHAIVVPFTLNREQKAFKTTVTIPEDGTWFVLLRNRNLKTLPGELGLREGHLGEASFSAKNKYSVKGGRHEYDTLGASLYSMFCRLKAGEHEFYIRANDGFAGDVDQALITRNPQLFLWLR